MRSALRLAGPLAMLGLAVVVACGEAEKTVKTTREATVRASPTTGQSSTTLEITGAQAPSGLTPSPMTKAPSPSQILPAMSQSNGTASRTVAVTQPTVPLKPVEERSLEATTFDRDRFEQEIDRMQPRDVRLSGIVLDSSLGLAEVSYAASSNDQSRMYVINYLNVRPPINIELREIGSQVYVRVVGAGLASLARWAPDWMSVPSEDVIGTSRHVFPPEADFGLDLLNKRLDAMQVVPCEPAPGCFVLEAPNDPSQWRLLVATDSYEPMWLVNQQADGTGAAEFRIEWDTQMSIDAPSGAHAITAEDFEGALDAAFQALLVPDITTAEITGDPDGFDWAKFNDTLASGLESGYMAHVSFINDRLGPMDISMTVGPASEAKSVIMAIGEGDRHTEIELRAIDGSTYMRAQAPNHVMTWVRTEDTGAQRLLPSPDFFHLDVFATLSLRALGMTPCADNATCWLMVELGAARRLVYVDATSMFPVRIEEPGGSGRELTRVVLEMAPTSDVRAPGEFETTSGEHFIDLLDNLIDSASIAVNLTPSSAPSSNRVRLEDEGRRHVAETTTPTYQQMPPASGDHYPRWARYGVHTEAIQPGYWVHNLEHGAIVLLYQCDEDCESLVENINDVYARLPNGAFGEVKLLATPFERPLEHKFLLIAWTWQESFDQFDADLVESFYVEFVDRGPEKAP